MAPHRDTKTLLPSTLQKAFSCRGPSPDCFQFFTRAPCLPPRSVPNCKQTGIEKGESAVAPPNSFDLESHNCPIQGMANDGRSADAPYFTREQEGGWYWRETLRPLCQKPVCAWQEVLWFANGNFKKVIHIESGLKRAGFGAKRLVIVQLVCACQGRVALSSLDLHLDSARRA